MSVAEHAQDPTADRLILRILQGISMFIKCCRQYFQRKSKHVLISLNYIASKLPNNSFCDDFQFARRVLASARSSWPSARCSSSWSRSPCLSSSWSRWFRSTRGQSSSGDNKKSFPCQISTLCLNRSSSESNQHKYFIVSDWVGCWQAVPGGPVCSSSFPVWTFTRRLTSELPHTRFRLRRWVWSDLGDGELESGPLMFS